MLDKITARGFEIEYRGHSRAILSEDFPDAVTELDEVLSHVSIPIAEIIGSGGGEAAGTQRMRHALTDRGWAKKTFEIKKVINDVERESISHEIDHVKTWPDAGTIALEIEWNNKDPFFDRDLENMKRLHAEGAISVGAIVTRGSTLQAGLRAAVLRFAQENKIRSFDDLWKHGVTPTLRQRRAVQARADRSGNFPEAWSSFFVADKFGEATTHWRKLEDRVRRGVGNPCPLLLIGLPLQVITF